MIVRLCIVTTNEVDVTIQATPENWPTPLKICQSWFSTSVEYLVSFQWKSSVSRWPRPHLSRLQIVYSRYRSVNFIAIPLSLSYRDVHLGSPAVGFGDRTDAVVVVSSDRSIYLYRRVPGVVAHIFILIFPTSYPITVLLLFPYTDGLSRRK